MLRDIEKVNHMIYHILPPETWKTAQSNHGYTPQAFPEDGFIHCSDLYQVEKPLTPFSMKPLIYSY